MSVFFLSRNNYAKCHATFTDLLAVKLYLPEMAASKEWKSPKNFKELFENIAAFVDIFIGLTLLTIFQLVSGLMSRI